MAQFMIVINGVILTLIAFFTINVFVKDALREEYSTFNDLIRKDISESFYDLETSLIESVLNSGKADGDLFDVVFLIDANPAHPVIPLKGALVTSPLIDMLHTAIVDEPEGPVLYADGQLKSVRKVTNVDVQMRRLVLLTKNKATPVTTDYIAALVNPEKFSQVLALEKNSSIRHIEIMAGPVQLPIYVMDNNLITQIKGESVSFHDQNIDLDVANTKLQARLSYLKQNQFLLIEVVPWLLLGFGMTLTVIGWMYVSNNQQKTILLAEANQTLEIRNRELGQQISEREKLNQTLRKSERENKAIIDAVSDVIFEIGLNGDILFINEAWTRITGFPVGKMITQNLFSLIHLHDQEEQRKNVSQLIKGQRQAYRAITRIRTSDGLFKSVEMAISMLRIDESKNLRIVGSFTDIDSRERAERALVEAERKYRSIWENAAGGIYQITPEGQFLSANPAMANIFGYDLAEHLLRDVRNAHQQLFVQPHERLRLIKALAPGDSAITIENQAYTRANRKIWVQEIIRPVFDGQGHLQYFEGSLQDISDRRAAEEQLRDAKLESDVANRAKSEFLANMSHELRTPLNSIIGFSEIIKNEVFGQVEPRPYWEYARDIHESGKHLLSIINQILDISRIDAGERELKESMVDISKVVGVCLEIVSPKAKSANLNLVEIGVDKAPKIIGEEVAIKQMIINLLTNAVKFTSAGGRITITAEYETTGPLRLSVTDTGVGLDDEEIERAMSPFGVLDGRLNKATSGIGLGLSLVQALMKLHGGRLEIFSQKGIGTTVTLVFPAERVQA